MNHLKKRLPVLVFLAAVLVLCLGLAVCAERPLCEECASYKNNPRFAIEKTIDILYTNCVNNRYSKESVYMKLAFISALGIGGATVIGAILGFMFKKIPASWNDGLMGFAAGVMLSAAMNGLIMPAVELVSPQRLWIVGVGMFLGAIFLSFMDIVVPHLHRLSGVEEETHHNSAKLDKVILFVLAIAIHNFPEGLAAGVAFGGENISGALSVTAGIILQNIPEGMIIISPMLLAGMKPGRTFFIALCTGLVEVLGTMMGYGFAVVASALLPFALSFAGGTMLYIVGDEMIPETHSHGHEKMATFSMMFGFFAMIIVERLI